LGVHIAGKGKGGTILSENFFFIVSKGLKLMSEKRRQTSA